MWGWKTGYQLKMWREEGKRVLLYQFEEYCNYLLCEAMQAEHLGCLWKLCIWYCRQRQDSFTNWSIWVYSWYLRDRGQGQVKLVLYLIYEVPAEEQVCTWYVRGGLKNRSGSVPNMWGAGWRTGLVLYLICEGQAEEQAWFCRYLICEGQAEEQV
jgi:hypothetical protein